MSEAVITTRALTKRYGPAVAVGGLDLDVYPGEVFGLLGPNGAGKTTTILMLLGLTEPTAGQARVVGLDPARDPLDVKRRVGYLPDNVGFYDGLTGRENLRYTARLNGLRGDTAEDRISQLLEQVGLTDAADRKAGAYSRGMRQRLGIADALVKQPDVVILDEPTIAIDPAGVIEILALIRSLAREHGAAVLLSSHLLHQVQSVCDRVGIFVAGRLVAVGSVPELAARFASDQMTMEVGIAADPSVVEPVLRGFPDITAAARHEHDPQTWTVAATADIRPQLVQALTRAGLRLLHLRRCGDALDEVYQRWFAAHEQEVDDVAA